MKLKIYSEQHWLTPEITPDVFFLPFWCDRFGEGTKQLKQHSWYESLQEYVDLSLELFELSSLEACDFAVLPVNWMTIRGTSWRSSVHPVAYAQAQRMAERVKAAGKELVIFFSGDCSDELVPLDAIVFHMSAYRSRGTISPEMVRPAFFGHPDLKDWNYQFSVRQKQNKPVVGFCGFARPPQWKHKIQQAIYHAKTLLDHGWWGVSPYKGQQIRYQALQRLQNSPRVIPNFVIKDSSYFSTNFNNVEVERELKIQYFRNTTDSDYILCGRGSANYSIRFFETLCCGRIPIFINTDSILPWDDQIDWKQYCVWVEEAELPTIAEKVAEFHDRLSPTEFVELQYEIRRFWKERLSPEAFALHLYQFLQARQTTPGAVPKLTKQPVSQREA